MIFKYIRKIKSNFLFICLLVVSTLANAYICTDDYIISGGRSITLLPDIPFEILETNKSLIVRRGTLILEFRQLKNITDNEIYVNRYSLEFIGDTYYFDLITNLDNKIILWEQYAIEPSKRGFGGTCRAD